MSHCDELVSVLKPVPSARTSWMSKSVKTGFPGGAPSKATHFRSGESRGRFAFCALRRIRRGCEPSGRIDQIDGPGDSFQYTITPRTGEEGSVVPLGVPDESPPMHPATAAAASTAATIARRSPAKRFTARTTPARASTVPAPRAK
jgi:hypothetical protein